MPDWCNSFESESREPPAPRRVGRAVTRIHWDADVITGLLLSEVRALFRQPDALEPLGLVGLTYDENSLATKILIEDVGSYDIHSAGIRPAVIVADNDMQSDTRGLGAGMDINDGRMQSNYDVFRRGSHTLSCIWQEKSPTRKLAEAVAAHFEEITPALCTIMQQFRVRIVGTPGQLDEERDRWLAPIVVAWEYQRTYRLNIESPILRGIEAVNTGVSDLVQFW
jgi:hypothetical protein